MHLVYQPLSGDGTIVARLLSTAGGNPDVGVMIRDTLDTAAANGYGWCCSYGNTIFWARVSTGAATTGLGVHYVPFPAWIKVVRSGGNVIVYSSADATNWVSLGSQSVTLGQNIYVGLAATSGTNSALTTATFDYVSVTSTAAPGPVITAVSATTGAPGAQVIVTGAGFGATQGNSAVMLDSTPMTINSWSDTAIATTVPAGATSGYLVVSVAPSMNDSNPVVFTVTSQPLPSGWLDLDIGAVPSAGSATYSNGVFTISGAGSIQQGTTTDTFHFVYRPISGDETIVARLRSIAGGNPDAGVMIRDTLDTAAANGFGWCCGNNNTIFGARVSTGTATTGNIGFVNYAPLPTWIKIARSGSNVTVYSSPDATNWVTLGSQAVSMGQNVYAGLAVTSGTNTPITTATFDNVSVSATSAPGPVITAVSATTGAPGNQVIITGSGFGATQGNSVVMLNAVPVTINSWSDTSITITIPAGATSGYLVVSVAPSMNDSNPVIFAVTSQPLPSGWLDSDIGAVPSAGSATYVNGIFTVTGAGSIQQGLATDRMHFVYRPLNGDEAIIARLLSLSGGTTIAGVMIRDTLDTSAANGFGWCCGYNNTLFGARVSTGAATTGQIGTVNYAPLPTWIKVVRSGSNVNVYSSADATNWVTIGSQSVSLGQNVYAGLAVTSGPNSVPTTATFGNVSIATGLIPVVTSVSPSSGLAGTTVTIAGSDFGATQGSSTVSFNGTNLSSSSITSWGNTQIVVTIPNTVSTGPVVVVVNGVQSNADVIFTGLTPAISSLAPPAAALGGTVTVQGYNFGASQGSSTVQFNSVIASIRSWSNTSVAVTVPSNATSGVVTLTANGATTNAVQFTVSGAPTITGISPASGAYNTPVTISGSGFGSTPSNSTAAFYGIAATTITSWSDTQIVANVPAGTGSGLVSVTVAGITAWGPKFTLRRDSVLTNSRGDTTTYDSIDVGGKWQTISEVGPGCSTCTDRSTVYTTYDASGNVLTKTDAAGHVTTYAYDASNNVTSVSAQLDANTTATTSYTYNSFGEVLTVTDPLGHVTTNVYDAKGNLTSVTSPAPDGSTAASVTQFAYDSKGELTSITDPLNHVTTMTYSTAGLIATITDAQSNVTGYQYDSRGNRTRVTDALTHQTNFAYDSMSRLTTITYPDSTTSTFAYDSRGRRTSATDQNNKTTTYAYDDADRLTSATDAASHVTTYAYDTENNLNSITDASSHSTYFTYDAFGRVTQTNFPSTLSENYVYDAIGNLTSKTDRKNQTINYVYDALNRLTHKGYPDSTGVDYVYDLVGKIQQVNDPTGTYAFAYDNMGRLLGTTTSYSFLTGRNFTNAYTYDAASNRTGFTDPENGSTTYTYDTLNRLTTLAPPSAFSTGSFGFSYDALSRRTQMTRPNSVATNYTYDNLSRLLSVLHQLSGSTIDGASYTLDSAGNRTAKTDQRAAVTSNYAYDAIYQLTQVTQATNTTESYTYDPVGNRAASLGVSSYTTNASNELTAIPGVTYTYDSNGNTLTKVVGSNTTSYSWDFENRMSSVTLPGTGGTVSFKYDPFGRRIEKISPTATSIFVYDADNLIETVNSSGGVVARYTQTQRVDEPLAMLGGTTTSYYEADGLGSVTSLSNTSGALAQTYTYDSFGNQTASSGSLTNFFRYTGREFDTETNLYYSRARYLDPSTGRFLSEDPIRYAGGSLNFYPYAGNDPVDYIDAFGTSPTCDKPKCFAQLKYRPVDDWRAKAFGRTHAFWYVQGSSGFQYIISGGPSNPNGSGFLNVWPPNLNTSGGVDNTSATVWWNSGLAPENCQGVDAMIAAAQGWPNGTIPYHAVEGPNSDTAAHSLGTSGGFNPSPPPGTMGWNTALPH